MPNLQPGHIRTIDLGTLVEQPRYEYCCLGCHSIFRIESIPKKAVCRSCGWMISHDLHLRAGEDGHTVTCRCGWKSSAASKDIAQAHADAHTEAVSLAARRLRAQPDQIPILDASAHDDPPRQ